MSSWHRPPFLSFALAFAVNVGCSDGADPGGAEGTPNPNDGVPSLGGSPGSQGGGVSQPGSGGTSGGTAPSSESPNAGIDGAPVVGTGNGGSPAAAGAGNQGSAGGAAAGGTGGTGPAPGSVFPSGVTRPRIMIVGDSIAAGPGCYKKYLLADLSAGGYSNFEFVGEYTDDCGGGVRHSARSCSTAEQYTQPSFTLNADCGGGTFPGLSALAATHRPDLIMLQLGVNDVWGGRSIESILANYALLITQARAQNPNVVVVVAQIQQIRPDSGGDAVFARAEQLVNAVPAWAAAQNQPQSRVFVADLWTNSDTARTETLDGVHPNDAGAVRMGQNWYEALKGILTPG